MVNWEKAGRPARAARAALSYDAIATAGIEVADGQGFDAVTMRKVADHLGAGAMSLYRYVDSRDDLLDLMADRVSAEAIAPPRTGDWRADLTGAAHILRDVTLRHPWLTRHATTAGGFGPNTVTMTESTLTLLDGYGLDIDEMLDVWRTLVAFVQGYASAEAQRLEAHRRRAEQAAADGDETGPSYLDTVAASGRYPLASRALLGPKRPVDPQQTFDRRLGYLLDGLAHTFFAGPR